VIRLMHGVRDSGGSHDAVWRDGVCRRAGGSATRDLAASGEIPRRCVRRVLSAARCCPVNSLPTIGGNDIRGTRELIGNASVQDNLYIFLFPAFGEGLDQHRN
jgi:hypothetical protein